MSMLQAPLPLTDAQARPGARCPVLTLHLQRQAACVRAMRPVIFATYRGSLTLQASRDDDGSSSPRRRPGKTAPRASPLGPTHRGDIHMGSILGKFLGNILGSRYRPFRVAMETAGGGVMVTWLWGWAATYDGRNYWRVLGSNKAFVPGYNWWSCTKHSLRYWVRYRLGLKP